MNPEQQQIAIAEVHFNFVMQQRSLAPRQQNKEHWQLAFNDGNAFGLWRFTNSEGDSWGVNYLTKDACIVANIQEWSGKHDYLSDLHAMHEAEKVLEEPQYSKQGSSRPQDHAQLRYYHELLSLASGGKQEKFGPFDYWRMINSTAAQRAEAFLKTLGKWIEDSSARKRTINNACTSTSCS